MGEPTISGMRACKAAGFAAVLALTVLVHPVCAAPASGSDTVQSLYDTLLSTMKNGHLLGPSGRFGQLEPIIRRTFDVASMARLSVGPRWAAMSENSAAANHKMVSPACLSPASH